MEATLSIKHAIEDAAEPVTYLCCARSIEGSTGKYLHVMVEKPAAAESLDPANRATLMRESEALIVRALGEGLRGDA